MANRRNTFIGDCKVLFRYKFVCVTALLNLILFGAFAYLVIRTLRGGDFASLGMGSLYLLGIVTTVLTFTSFGLAIYSVLSWHRLLGAAYRIQTSLKEVKSACEDNRELPAVKLRKGDQLMPLADEVNELVSTLVAKN